MAAGGHSPQIGRIARLLGVDPTDVHGLDEVADADLRVLHDLIGERLFRDGREPFARVAALSKLLPGSVAGKLAERFLPPTLAARVAVLLEPAKARDLVGKVSVGYLAELALVLDPVRSRPVVQAIPPDRVAEVARALFGRGEYAAMAEFAGTVTLDALFAALDVATPRDLLEVVPLLVWNENIDTVIADVPPAKIDQVLREVVDQGLWAEGNYLLDHLPAQAQERALARAEDVPDEVFSALQAAAKDGRLEGTALELLRRAEHARTRA